MPSTTPPPTASLPAYLLTSPSSELAPPAQTRAQELPFDGLSWKDFERLCLRLAERQSAVESCRLYGVQGDDQEGIDLLAREHSSGLYRVYQCKRVRDFQPAKIRAAVEAFLEGSWRDRATEFYLCTMESLALRARTDELVIQRTALQARGVALRVWDADALDQMLKGYPEVVDDFFGRPWVEFFCGHEVAASLGQRLDKVDAAGLRRRLGQVYFQLFRRQDPVFLFRDPSQEAAEPLVLPDVLPRMQLPGVDVSDTPRPRRQISPAGWSFNEEELPEEYEDPDPVALQRSAVMAWLAEGKWSLVVGGPGSGKSTLLRALALDLLSVSPQGEAGRAWGLFLPIWLPFARWTAMLAEGRVGKVSLKAFLTEWLSMQSAEEVIPLVERALEDKRLLLLVDGLDEWQSDSAARNAMVLLQSFAAERDIPVVATSRPRGLTPLGLPGSDWRLAHVAPLSPGQQHHIATVTLRQQDSRQQGITHQDTSSRASLFLKQVARKEELSTIAKTPLLLGLLAQLWHHETELPDNRFKAYNKLVELLLVTHPARRNTAALAEPSELVSQDDLFRAMTVLAWEILERFPSGSISRQEAHRILETFLADRTIGLALDLAQAKAKAREIVSFATDSAALLVATSPTEVGFYHRALLEYLAASSLATRPTHEQQRVVQERAPDPRWHEVILALASLTRSLQAVGALIEAIRAGATTHVDKILSLPLLANVAFGTSSCPPGIAQEIAKKVLDEIEVGDYLPVRRQLLAPALRGLRPGPTQAAVRERLERWLPRRFPFRSGVYRAAGDWPRSPEVDAFLWRGLRDEQASESRAAASALVKFSAGDASLRDRILRCTTTSASPRVRGSLLLALVEAEVGVPAEVCDRIVGTSPAGELAFAGVRSRIARGAHEERDLHALLRLDDWHGGLDYELRDELPSVIASGWPTAPTLRDLCLAALARGHGGRDAQPSSDTARRILIQNFSGHLEVERRLAAEFDSEHGPFDRSAWPLYAEFARGSTHIKKAIDRWLQRDKGNVVNAHWAALTSRSRRAKSKMLSALGESTPHWAARALLDGWGMNDKEVAKALLAIASGPDARAAQVALLLPRILTDREACQGRLTELLSGGQRLDFVVRGLAEMRSPTPEPDVVDSILHALEMFDRFRSFRAMPILIESWADDGRIEALAHRELAAPEGSAQAVAVAAKRFSSLREALQRKIGVIPAPLRTATAERLGDAAWLSSPQVRAALGDYAFEMQSSPRTQSALSYYATPSALSTLSRLQEEVSRTGPHMEAFREAAFCGFLSLDRLDDFREAREDDGNKPAALRLGWRHSFNGPFWRSLSEYWPKISDQLQESVEERLSGEQPADNLWEGLAAFAQPGTRLATDVLRHADDLPAERFGVNLLRFLERMRPRSGKLRDVCIASMCPDRTRPDLRLPEVRVTACQVLGSSFRGDEDVLRLLAERTVPGNLWFYPVLALCIGWQDSEALRGVFEFLRGRSRHDLPYSVSGSVVATMSSRERVVNLLETHARPRAGVAAWEVTAVTPLLARRLRSEDEVARDVLSRLRDLDSPSAAGAIRLLAEAGGLTPELESEIRRRVEPVLAGTEAPDACLDPMTGRERPTWTVLLDALFARQ